MTSRVVPATGATIDRRVPVMRLKSVDLPTFGRPTSTRCGRRAWRDIYARSVAGPRAGRADCLTAGILLFIVTYGYFSATAMIKVDIVNEVSRLADITKVKAELAVDAVFDAMRASMMRGERIELRGFGVFQVKPRKRGIGRNPRTGKEVRIPPGRTIRFKPGKELQNITGQSE